MLRPSPSRVPLARLVRSARLQRPPRRLYSAEPPPPPRSASVFSPTAAGLFVVTLVGLVVYFRHEKARHIELREKEATAQYGRPKIGGPFALTSHTGATFTDKDLLGKWSLVYFGFTNCPDICPAELDKMTEIVNAAEKEHGPIFQPVFISVDPARDSVTQMKRYLEDFHPALIGLVGTYAQTKAICRAYRVYFSTPPDADPKGDYLVDHSIFVYLMDPNGQFVEAFGQVSTAEEVVNKTREFIAEWKQKGSV